MLKGLVSFITGGASGLGKATAQHLATNGGRVALVDLPSSLGSQAAQEIGDNVLFLPCDVRSNDEVKNALERCKEEFGRLDLAINCAALTRSFKIANPRRQNKMGLNEFLVTYEAAVYGTFNVASLAASLMAENKPKDSGHRGLIINIGSISSEDGCVGQSAFSASKAAVSAMTLPMAREFSSLGIRVVTIAPGLFGTPLTSEDCLTEQVQDYFKEQLIFPKGFGHPHEFAEMVESIVCNSMLNGETIKLSGGLRFHFVSQYLDGEVEYDSANPYEKFEYSGPTPLYS